MIRLYPGFVSALGVVGLSLALFYGYLVVLAFIPGYDQIASFMVGSADTKLSFGFTTFVIPYSLLLVHLYLRVRLGAWLLERGAVDRAIAFSSRRAKPSLLLSRREALANRTTLARAHVVRGEYDEAWKVLDEATRLPSRGSFLQDYRRWQLEVCLRRENLVDARRIVQLSAGLSGRTPEMAAFHACVAEIYIREGDEPACRDALERARWASKKSLRADWSHAQALVRFRHADPEARHAVALLDGDTGLDVEVPLRAAEVQAVRAALLSIAGEESESRAALARARTLPADSRARFVLGQQAGELGEEEE